jgi:hypothetical protein
LANACNERLEGKVHVPKALQPTEVDHNFMQTFLDAKKELPFSDVKDAHDEIKYAISKNKGKVSLYSQMQTLMHKLLLKKAPDIEVAKIQRQLW